MESASTFYDGLAGQYETLTQTTVREKAVREVVAELHRRTGFRSALDAACGTGLFTFALAEFAHPVYGADISGAMLEQARGARANRGHDVDWIHAPMQELADTVATPVDIILCMGNSLPHVLTLDDVRKTLAGFADLLNSGGTVLLHQINFDRVFLRAERLVGATWSEGVSFVRFYDLMGERVRFNVVETRWEGQPPATHWHCTDLRGHRHAELVAALQSTDFSDIRCWGDLSFAPFDRRESELLVLEAKKR